MLTRRQKIAIIVIIILLLLTVALFSKYVPISKENKKAVIQNIININKYYNPLVRTVGNLPYVNNILSGTAQIPGLTLPADAGIGAAAQGAGGEGAAAGGVAAMFRNFGLLPEQPDLGGIADVLLNPQGPAAAPQADAGPVGSNMNVSLVNFSRISPGPDYSGIAEILVNEPGPSPVSAQIPISGAVNIREGRRQVSPDDARRIISAVSDVDLKATDIFFIPQDGSNSAEVTTLGASGRLAGGVENNSLIPVNNVKVVFDIDHNAVAHGSVNLRPHQRAAFFLPNAARFNEMGTHTIWLRVDPDNHIMEIDESNNMVQRQIHVVPRASTPNLKADGIEYYDSSGHVSRRPFAGEIGKVRFGVFNNGSIPVENFKITVKDNGRELGQRSVPLIEPNGSKVYDFENVSFREPGRHVLSLLVDSPPRIEEINEDDNTATFELEVQPSRGSGPIIPSVRAVKVGFMPNMSDYIVSETTIGIRGKLISVVENTGNVRYDNLTVRIILDGRIRGEGPIRLEPQSTANYEVSNIIFSEPGMHTMRFMVDPNNRLADVDRSDNMVESTLNVLPSPVRRDLQAWRISFIPEDGPPVPVQELMVNQPTKIDCEIANGSHIAFNNVKVRVETGNNIISEGRVNVGMDEESLVHYVIDNYRFTEPGTRLVRVIVDPDNEIGENENTRDNNVSTATVHVVTRENAVDAKAEGIAVIPMGSNTAATEIKVNLPVRISVVASNTGRVTVSNLKIEVLVDKLVTRNGQDCPEGIDSMEATIGNIPGGQFASHTFNYVFTEEGRYSLSFWVDPHNDLREVRENNNLAKTTIRVSERPVAQTQGALASAADALAANIQFVPKGQAAPVSETTVNRLGEIRAGLRNLGGIAINDIVFRVTVDGENIDEDKVSLNPGQSASCSISDFYFDTPGLHKIGLEVDPDNRLAESDESNNILESQIYVRQRQQKTPPADEQYSNQVVPDIIKNLDWGSVGRGKAPSIPYVPVSVPTAAPAASSDTGGSPPPSWIGGTGAVSSGSSPTIKVIRPDLMKKLK